ncbi:hypothetical protein [Thermomonas flagellata]|uniref:hypothetical protein n=1 Tax=Thermomonas flagellata TaxID=2888524 RepID=UPI001F035795|nr:hypothetical protein [Thermomonas flagellata]
MRLTRQLQRVQRAERVFEALQQQTLAHWQGALASWRRAWTPGRIVAAGLVLGLALGRARPVRWAGRASSALRLLGTLSGLVAGAEAQLAALRAATAPRPSTPATEPTEPA